MTRPTDHPNVKSSKKELQKKSKKTKKIKKEEKRKKKYNNYVVYIFKCNSLFPPFPTKFFMRLQYGYIYQLLPALEKKTNFRIFDFIQIKTSYIATIKRLFFGEKRKINYNFNIRPG